MPDEKEKKPEFVVTDRRLFSSEGELRQDVVEAEERREEREREQRETQERANEERAAQNNGKAEVVEAAPPPEPEMQAPSEQEQHASEAAYQQTARDIDQRIDQEMRKQGRTHNAKDFEVSFDKFIASMYMTSLMQLGLAAPQGAKPEVDLIGARQTIDTLAMLQQKTKGNLAPAEENMFQNLMYELRMAYLEVTNMLTHPPQGGVTGDGKA